MNAKQWLHRVTDDASVNAVAQKTGVPQKTLDTQLRSATGLKPDKVVKIARAYEVSPVWSLVELGLITSEEARDAARIADSFEQMSAEVALRHATDEQILVEIQRRLKERTVTLGDESGEGLD